MESSFYFKFQILDALAKETPKPGETILGVVFTQGIGAEGTPLLFPFIRIQDATKAVYLKEITDPEKAGCPYPPPCKNKFRDSCYEGELG